MKLLEPVRDKMRFLHSALDTEKSYLRWIEQYIRFHKVGGTPHGRSSVGFGLASPTRIREVKKSQAIRRKWEFVTCTK